MSNTSTGPKCSDPLYGYGIGNCCGCNRFPVVIYKSAVPPEKWRCAPCYTLEHGSRPANLVQA